MLARPEDFDGADFELQVGGPSFPKHCKVVMKPVTSLCKFVRTLNLYIYMYNPPSFSFP